jgi:hypothetical protein
MTERQPVLQAAAALLALLGALTATAAFAQAAKKPAAYPAMAPFEQYASPNLAAEVALARSAAPASISAAAEVLVLGPHGYETGARGENGFVCLVERSWNTSFDDPEFWNPKVRAPNCYNAAAARSVLPAYLRRSKLVLEGSSIPQVQASLQAAIAAKTITAPELGAMSYMMSKDSYLGDAVGHAHPHLMIYLPRSEASAWGANLPGGVVTADQGAPEPLTIFFAPMPKWSDGSLSMPMK